MLEQDVFISALKESNVVIYIDFEKAKNILEPSAEFVLGPVIWVA